MGKKKPQPKATGRKQKTRGLALTDEIFQRLQQRAEKDEVSMSLTARRAITLGLDKLEAEAARSAS